MGALYSRLMRTIYILAILISLLTACAAPTISPTSISTSPPTEAPFASREALTGEWLGGFTKSDGAVASLLLNFDEANLTIEPQTKSWPLTIASQDDENIHFTVTGKTGKDFEQIDFTGSLSNGILTGDLNWDGQTSSITFNPIYAIDSALLENYAGVYRFESGRALSVIQSPSYDQGGLRFFHQGLMMTDFESGDSRGLYPLDDFTFAVGALRVVGAPFDGRVQFVIDDQGQAMGLMWWDKFDGITPSAESGQYAARVNYSTEEVTFTSADGAVMAGLSLRLKHPN